MKPVRDLILIEADKPQEKTKSGLYIAEDWKALPPSGTVLAVGSEVTSVKEGDRVVFERYGSVTYKDQQRLVKESQVIGILDGTTE